MLKSVKGRSQVCARVTSCMIFCWSLQVRLLQCALVRFLQDVVSCDGAIFPIAQQRGLQAGAKPTLLLINDMLFQACSPFSSFSSSLSFCYCTPRHGAGVMLMQALENLYAALEQRHQLMRRLARTTPHTQEAATSMALQVFFPSPRIRCKSSTCQQGLSVNVLH